MSPKPAIAIRSAPEDFFAGTSLEMPLSCDPSKYAVAKSMAPAVDQSLPERLAKRDNGHQPTIYDLTFNFE